MSEAPLYLLHLCGLCGRAVSPTVVPGEGRFLISEVPPQALSFHANPKRVEEPQAPALSLESRAHAWGL